MNKAQTPNRHAVDQERTEHELSKYLCFFLGDKHYGINISHIKEIIEYMETTPIPMMPEFLRGAINLRNKIIPVVDISSILGMPVSDTGKRTCIIRSEILLRDTAVDVGLLVDAVNQVADVPASQIESAPSLAGTINTDFIHGIVNLNDNFTILLNLEAVFSLEELEAVDQFYQSYQKQAAV